MIEDLQNTATLHLCPIDLSKDVLIEPLQKTAGTGKRDKPLFYPIIVWDAIWILTDWLDDLCDTVSWILAYVPAVNYECLKMVYKYALRIIVVSTLVDINSDTTTIIIDFMVQQGDTEVSP